MMYALFTLCCSLSVLQWTLLILLLLLTIIWYMVWAPFKQYGDLAQLKPHWFLGNNSFGGQSMNDVYNTFYKATAGNKYAIFWNGRKPCLFIRDLDLLKSIQVKDFDHFTDFGFTDADYVKAMGNQFGVAEAIGEEWKTLKKLVTPPFGVPRLKKSISMMNKNGEKLLKYLSSIEASGKVLDARKALQKFCMNTIANVGFGIDIDCFEDEKNEFNIKGNQLFDQTWRFLGVNIFPGICGFLKIGLYNPVGKKYFLELAKKIIKQRKNSKNESKDIIGNLVKVSQENPTLMTDEMMFLTCVQFFTDGYGTASDILSIILYLITVNKDVQERAQQEIDNVFDEKSGEGEITEEDLKKLPYLDQIFSEGLRLGCIAFTGRECTKEYKLPGTDFIVPKGMIIRIPIIGLHHDSQYWENPYKFDPDRWSNENKGKIASAAYQPFGMGPRQCLGNNFIKLESKIMLAQVLRNFSLLKHGDMPERIQWDENSFVGIKGGVNIKLNRRF